MQIYYQFTLLKPQSKFLAAATMLTQEVALVIKAVSYFLALHLRVGNLPFANFENFIDLPLLIQAKRMPNTHMKAGKFIKLAFVAFSQSSGASKDGTNDD